MTLKILMARTSGQEMAYFNRELISNGLNMTEVQTPLRMQKIQDLSS